VNKHALTHQSDQGDHRRLLAGDEIVRILLFAALALAEAIRFVKNTVNMRTGIAFFFLFEKRELFLFRKKRNYYSFLTGRSIYARDNRYCMRTCGLWKNGVG
jgi:hypothetical protein